MARSQNAPASAAPASTAGRATTNGSARPSRRARPTRSRARARDKLGLRLLADGCCALAERHVRELEDAPAVDADKLMQALEVLKMARLEAMGRSAATALAPTPRKPARNGSIAAGRDPHRAPASCAAAASISTARRRRRLILVTEAHAGGGGCIRCCARRRVLEAQSRAREDATKTYRP